MTAPATPSERERFEAWASQYPYWLDRIGDQYERNNTACAWAAWQARATPVEAPAQPTREPYPQPWEARFRRLYASCAHEHGPHDHEAECPICEAMRELYDAAGAPRQTTGDKSCALMVGALPAPLVERLRTHWHGSFDQEESPCETCQEAADAIEQLQMGITVAAEDEKRDRRAKQEMLSRIDKLAGTIARQRKVIEAADAMRQEYSDSRNDGTGPSDEPPHDDWFRAIPQVAAYDAARRELQEGK